MSLIGIVILLGMAQGFILVAAINHMPNRNELPNRILSLFVTFISITLLFRFLVGQRIVISRFNNFIDMPLFAYGPLFYLYFVALLAPQKMNARWWLHFVPMGLHICLITLRIFELNDSTLLKPVYWVFRGETNVTLALILMANYLRMSFRLLRDYDSGAKDQVSFQLYLGYLYTFLILVIFCWVAWIYGAIAYFTELPAFKYLNYGIAWIAMSLTTFTLAYFALTRQEVFKLVSQPPPRYQSSSLPGPELTELKEKLKLLMQERKPHFDPTLTAVQLAEMMGLPIKDLSQLINVGFQEKFYDFVNRYRVEEFKRLIKEGKHKNQTILAVAFDAGFNSKSTFNGAFKKFTQITPSEYLKDL